MRLAVVGDIGSGKSYVAKQFGYPVFNADSEVAKLYDLIYIRWRKRVSIFRRGD